MDTIAAYNFKYLPYKILKRNKWKCTVYNYKSGYCWIKEIDGLLFRYYDKSCISRVEFSIPKYLYGSNAILFNYRHTKKLIKKINRLVHGITLGVHVHSFGKWIVTRADYPAHYNCKSQESKKAFLKFYNKVEMPYGKKTIYTTGAGKGNRSHQVILYDKLEEVMVHHPEMLDFLRIENVVRLEVQISNSKLKKLGLNLSTVSDYLNEEVAKKILDNYLVLLGFNLKVMTKLDLLKTMESIFKKEFSDMTKIIFNLNNHSKEYAIRKSSKYYYNKCISELKLHGISPYYFGESSEKINLLNFEYCSDSCIHQIISTRLVGHICKTTQIFNIKKSYILKEGHHVSPLLFELPIYQSLHFHKYSRGPPLHAKYHPQILSEKNRQTMMSGGFEDIIHLYHFSNCAVFRMFHVALIP